MLQAFDARLLRVSALSLLRVRESQTTQLKILLGLQNPLPSPLVSELFIQSVTNQKCQAAEIYLSIT